MIFNDQILIYIERCVWLDVSKVKAHIIMGYPPETGVPVKTSTMIKFIEEQLSTINADRIISIQPYDVNVSNPQLKGLPMKGGFCIFYKD